MKHCIWCSKPVEGSQPKEHIVPEAIGCPEGFVLSDGEVCGPCNNRLAHLDQSLSADLEVFAMMAGVPRKHGRPPEISSFGNLRAEVRSGQPEWYFNMGPGSLTTQSGRSVPPFRGRDRDVRANIEIQGKVATIDFPFSFGTSPKTARALVKIAGEYLCLQRGREAASETLQGPVADFVCFGKGERPIILSGFDKSKYQHRFDQIWRSEKGGYFCPFRLAHFEVGVDLSSDCSSFASVSQEMYRQYGPKGWTTLPPGAFSPES